MGFPFAADDDVFDVWDCNLPCAEFNAIGGGIGIGGHEKPDAGAVGGGGGGRFGAAGIVDIAGLKPPIGGGGGGAKKSNVSYVNLKINLFSHLVFSKLVEEVEVVVAPVQLLSVSVQVIRQVFPQSVSR